MPERPSRFARQAIKAAEAQRRLLERAVPLPIEQVPLAEALGRRLGESFAAPEDVPHFRRSGLDGFAVRSADAGSASASDPALLRIVGESPAGCEAPPRVEPGTAVRIMTGALVPEGADAVVMFEQTDAFARSSAAQPREFVAVRHPVRPGQNVAVPGDDVRRGDLLLAAGTLLAPGHIGILAAFGVVRARVRRRPVVGILPTGGELVGAGEPLRPGRVRNSNAPMLAAQIAAAGALPRELGVAADAVADVRERVRLAWRECDLVVTTGGVSVGDYDALAEWFRELPAAASAQAAGDVLLFNKIAMRPGSPTSAAWIGGKPLIALSGNPGACFVGFELFVRPVLQAMQGAEPATGPLPAFCGGEYAKGSPHDRYERARLEVREGKLYASPLGGKSSMIRSLLEANALMVIPAGPEGIRCGDPVSVIPLGACALQSKSTIETEWGR